MILVIGQNSVWQNTYRFERIDFGNVNRTRENYAFPAGKGSNVARALGHLGVDSHLVAYSGGPNGEKFRLACAHDGIVGDFIPIRGETRICTTLIESDGRVTEIVEPSPPVNEDERNRFSTAFRAALPRARLLVISGTAAVGEPATVYREMVDLAHEHDVPVVLDSYRDHGRAALESGPEVLKINLDELAELAAMPVEEPNARYDAYRVLARRHRLRWILITMGAGGAEGFDGTQVYGCTVPAVDAVNPIGSGDSFTAGVAAEMLRAAEGDSFERAFDFALPDALRTAAAAGTANCMSLKPGRIEAEHYRYARAGTDVILKGTI